MNYKIVIASYDRLNIIQKNTLKMLKEQHINKEKIYIFVSTLKDYEEYTENIDKNLYHKIILGEKGLLNTLEYIRNYFKEDEKIVRLDDDIEYIFKKKYSKKSWGKEFGLIKKGLNEKQEKRTLRKKMDEYEIINLNELIIKGFNKIKELDITLWGINKVQNCFFMTDGYSTDLRFITGTFTACINKKDKKYDYKISTNDDYLNEDIETTLIRFINDGKVLRMNEYGYKALKSNFTEGGIQSHLNKKDRLRNTKKINKTFNEYYRNYGKLKPNRYQDEMFILHRRKKETKKTKKTKKFIIAKRNFFIYKI